MKFNFFGVSKKSKPSKKPSLLWSNISRQPPNSKKRKSFFDTPNSENVRMLLNQFKEVASKKDSKLNWAEAKRRYPKLKPFADTDGDGVLNAFDCRPLNKKKQGFKHNYSFSYADYPATKTVKMAPDKFLEHTWKEGGKQPVYRKVDEKPKEVSLKEYKEQIRELDRESIDYLKEKIKSKEEDVSIGFISMIEGKPSGHEGRHTAIAAEEVGAKEIPVTIETYDEKDIEGYEPVKEKLQARYAQDKKNEEANREMDEELEELENKEDDLE